MTLALAQLFDDVVARFADETPPPAVPVPNHFGFREWARHKTSSGRIVWAPGDRTGALGSVGGAKYPGSNPRRLLTLGELFTVSISGVDKTKPEDELAQYRATRTLVDAWLRAVALAASGRFSIVSSEWDTTHKERQHGMAVHIVGAIDAHVLDTAHPVVSSTTDGARGTSAVSTFDVTESVDNGVVIPSVRVATTGPIALLGLQTIDGIALDTDDRVLVKDQADPTANGPYLAAAGVWSRDPDFDTSADFASGLFFHVELGAVNGDAGFELTTHDPISLGVSPLTFTRTSP